MMTVDQVAEAMKKGWTINAPHANWISAHALLEQELLAELRKARDAMDLTSPLARQTARIELDEYLSTWRNQ